MELRRVAGLGLCASCGRSYDRYNAKDSTTLGLIKWAAKRSRAAECKRQREVKR